MANLNLPPDLRIAVAGLEAIGARVVEALGRGIDGLVLIAVSVQNPEKHRSRVFEIGIEDPLMIAVDRLQHSHLSENHRAVVLCRPRASGRGLLTAWPLLATRARRINVF